VKIVHVSDVHIRNLKYHDDYRKVFDGFYQKLDEIQPDVVINTGDTAHTKTQISPEYVDLTSEFIYEISQRCGREDIILGNHDLNLMNPDRQDALTPIVESLGITNVHLHKKSGMVELRPGWNLWVFSLADYKNYPTPEKWKAREQDVNIGAFHGSIMNCVTDSNWRMTHVEYELDIFEGLDYVLLGDIHKQQFFKENRIAYAGSMVQQNFGEELDKGFLLWDIKGKDEHSVSPIYLKGSRKFHTIRLRDDLSIPRVDIEEGSRIRISPPRSITLVEQKAIEKEVKKVFQPYDVITLSAVDIGQQTARVGRNKVDVENLRQIAVQERMIRNFLKDRKVSDRVMDKILDMNRRYQVHIDQEDDTTRNVSWRINKLAWSNLFNYGAENVIDFDQLGGLTGLFAPNGSGKSNLLDILLETCFDSTTKGVSKNIHLINDNKEQASAVADITANDQNYLLERKIERIRYGQKKFEGETREWGKTSVNFARFDSAGGLEPLVGTLRPETESNIRQRLGTYDDFLITSLSAQWNPLDIVACKETKRKEIFYRFFDLDFAEKKCILAKNESRKPVDDLQRMEDEKVEESKDRLTRLVTDLRAEIGWREKHTEGIKEQIARYDEWILEKTSQKSPVDKVLFDLTRWAGDVKKLDWEIDEQKKRGEQLNLRISEKQIPSTEGLDFDQQLLETKVQALATLEREFQRLSKSRDTLAGELSRAKKEQDILTTVPCGDQFPTCRFLVNAYRSKDRIPDLTKGVEDVGLRIVDVRAEQLIIDADVDKLEATKKVFDERENVQKQIASLRLQLENVGLKVASSETKKAELLQQKEEWERIEADLKRNAEIDTDIAEDKRQKKYQMDDLSKFERDVNDLNKRLGSAEGELQEVDQKIDALRELRDTSSAYEHYIEAMGKDGIAYEILLQKLPLINEEINKILSSVTDFNVIIEHDKNEEAIRFYLQYGSYKMRLIELGGGAEKFLASVALRCALLNISNLPKSNMFIIDEGFGKLDPKNLESVQRMFDYLRTVFDHVIVVSHIETMKDMVDNIIDIAPDGEGYAHVEIGG
jgi:predicted phosphodiesterase